MRVVRILVEQECPKERRFAMEAGRLDENVCVLVQDKEVRQWVIH